MLTYKDNEMVADVKSYDAAMPDSFALNFSTFQLGPMQKCEF